MPDDSAPSPVRAFARRASAALCGAPVFRLWNGRWPSASERRAFAQGWGAASPDELAPIPRALMRSRAGDRQLERLILARLIRGGALPQFAAHGPTAQAGNPLAFWQGPPIGFLHVEKTGGSALAAALARHFHPMQIASHPEAIAAGLPGPGDWPPTSASRLGRAALLWGHFGLQQFAVLPPDKVLITMLRTPRARIMSLYQFWRSIRPEHLPAIGDQRVTLAHTLPFAAFLREPLPQLQDSIDNVYVRRLTRLNGGGTPQDYLWADPEAGLAAAKQGLAGFAWVGFTDRFADAFSTLSARLGITLDPNDAGANKRENNPTDWPLLYRAVPELEIGPEEDALLRRMTALDDQLYAAALARFG